MYIIIAQNDLIQRKFIEEIIKRELPTSKIKHIATESEFRNNFESFANKNPDILIINTMIRWTDPSPNMEKPPKEILDEGFYRAGIRCIRMLNDDERTKSIAVILYTILDFEDVKEEIENLQQVTYLYRDFSEKNLIKMIKSKLK